MKTALILSLGALILSACACASESGSNRFYGQIGAGIETRSTR